jgi:hypothetical protein
MGKYYIYIYIYNMCVCVTMLILSMFIYKSFYGKKIKFFSRYHCCSNVSSSEDSNAFLINLIDIFVNFLKYMCRSWKNL